jgi:hypothetical protein
VDVTVVNTNGTQSTLLSAFQFEQTGVVVALPVTNGNYGTQVELGLSAANVVGLRAVDMTITFDPTVLSVVDARVGPLTAGWALSANLNTPGRAVLSLANASSVTGSGSLVLLRFNILKAPPASTTLSIESLSLNDGAMTAIRSDGSFTVNGFFTIAGTVRYFSGSQVVPGASLNLVGAGAFQTISATNGGFAITNIPTGSYVLTPAKTNQVAEITGYDASLVLQAAAGLLTLSPSQILAADVNRNGSVSAMDASYILEKAVGLIDGPFPGAGKMWDFVPNQRSYSLLNGDLARQDFTAVLIGDVSGNWAPPSPPEGGLKAAGGIHAMDEHSSELALVAVDSAPVSAPGEQILRVLLQVTNPAVYSADLVLSYTPTNRAIVGVLPSADSGLSIASNTNTAGTIRIGLAGVRPFAINGPLVLVRISGSEPVSLHLDQISLNEDLLPTPTPTTVAAFDSDHDGLIDYDELNVFHTDPANPDTDCDGMTDGAEVRAGTSPLDRFSVFTLRECASTTDGSWRITWSAVPGKHYQLECRDDLSDSPWKEIGLVILAETEAVSVTDSLAVPGGVRLYRVRLVE